MAKSKTKKADKSDEFLQAEIQEKGNRRLHDAFEKITDDFPDVFISIKSEETQKDRGIDFEVEIVEKSKAKTFEVFKIQNKGTMDPVSPLVKTVNKGYISFQLSVRHVRYYRREMPSATMFTLCDITNNIVYWHPIQLDDTVDERADDAEKSNQETIQIYIDPANKLDPANFKRFLSQIELSKRQQFFRTLERDNPITSGPPDFQTDTSKHLLDQLFDLMEHLYDEVRYLPQHLLIRNKPFKKADSFTPYYHSFKVVTDNKELVQVLKSITINADQSISFTDPEIIKEVKDAESKAKSILIRLSQNHIYWVGTDHGREDASTRLFSDVQCDCAACRYYRLDIVGAMKEVESESSSDLLSKLKAAYMHYQLGNYKRSADLQEEVAKESKSANKNVLYMITQFNLFKLAKLIRNGYYDHETTSYGAKLLKIDLDKAIFSTATKGHNLKLSLWIKNQNFINEPAYDLQTAAGKLRDVYQGHIEGNKGNYRYFEQLVNAYAQLNSFVNGNYLVYDKYGEYHQLVDAFTEGVFAAISMHGEQGNMPEHLNDYHLHRFIFDGNQESIWRYFNKYKLTSVKYKQLDESEHLVDIVMNLLNNDHLVEQATQIYSPQEGYYWRNKYPMLFANTLCIASILEMSDKDAEEIVDGIIKCMTKSILQSPDCYVNANAFFARKHQQLKLATLRRLFLFCIEQKDAYAEKRFNIIANALKFRKELAELTKVEETKLLSVAFPDDSERSYNISVYVYPVLKPALQQKIIGKIETILNKKFSSYRYYYAIMFDLPVNQKYLTEFIKQAVPDSNKYNIRPLFYGKEENSYPLLDMLFNLCFKLQYDLKSITDISFYGFGDYYDWLLNIENFDYSKFKINWLGLYSTKFYFQEFRRYPIIKQKLEAYLKDKRDPRMERLYLDLYNPLNSEPIEDE